MYRDTLVANRANEEKAARRDLSVSDDTLDLALAVAARLGASPRPGGRLLDLGCGIGDTVSAMVARGFDGQGVDIGEWWESDHDSYWLDTPKPPPAILERLAATSETNYRLPYAEASFDFAMSAQVFEHVFNYEEVFEELGRVLKPDAISVHVFPGRKTLFEPHLFILFTFASHWAWWQGVWAFFVRRHRRTWRKEYDYLHSNMLQNNYPSERQLRRHARAAGVQVSFVEPLYVEFSNSRPRRLFLAARRFGLGWLARPILARLCQRCMVIQPQQAAHQP